MTDRSTTFTATQLMAAASTVLKDGGYQQIQERFDDWDTPTSRIFEDEYNVVGLAIFDTCGELLQTWPDLQGALVEVISKHIGIEEGKAWDGYLVLLTPALAPSEDAEVEAVRYDTVRVRKLVATGDDLQTSMDIERVLRPLLPIRLDQPVNEPQSALDLLPKLLAEQGIPMQTTRILVDAFRDQSPLLERLHDEWSKR